VTEFKLYPMQQRALITQANEVLYGGALGGGKSYLARVASIIYSLEVPGLITYLFRRTFKEVLANHVYTPGGYLEMLKGLIDAGECVFSKSDFSFSFANGSRIQLAHSQHESDIYTPPGGSDRVPDSGRSDSLLAVHDPVHPVTGAARIVESASQVEGSVPTDPVHS
jgi:hypothetical protein